MSPSATPRLGQRSSGPRRARTQAGRVIAGTLAVALTVTGLAVTGAQNASAAAPLQAQSVGNFLDGALGGGLIDPIVKLKYATAVSPGQTSVQNPLDITALNAVNLPLTGALQLPEILGIKLGAVNQVAHANPDGSSFGASGAVNNCGGVSVGCPNSSAGSFPADATIDLSAAGLSAGSPIPIPGGDSAAALGGVKLTIGAVSALAQTPAGFGKPGTTNYNIASLKLSIGSPALGQLLTTLSNALNPSGVLSIIAPLIKGVLPPACNLTKVLLPTSLSLEGGAIVISATDASITVDLTRLLQQLNLNLNQLPPNTDLIDYLLTYLSSVNGLTKGVEGLIHGLTDNLQAQFADCSKAVPLLPAVLAALTSGQKTLEAAVNGLVGSLGSFGGTGNPLAPLGAVLKKLIDIGVNVQPNGPAGTFKSSLAATPKQGTPVVAGQTIVRAIEVNLVGDPLATLALANAAAGPGLAPVRAPAATTAPPVPPNTNIPTGVPAGYARPVGSPGLPLILLVIGLLMAGCGAVAWKRRGKHVL